MSYPPPGGYPPAGGYGYPQNTGYPPQQPSYGQPPAGAPGYGYGAGAPGGMPTPGAPAYGQPGYGQPVYGQPGYGQPAPYPGAGMPMPNTSSPSMQGMAYAASAAVNFRPQSYQQQPVASYGGMPQPGGMPHPGGMPQPGGMSHPGGMPQPAGQPYPGSTQPQYPNSQQAPGPYTGASTPQQTIPSNPPARPQPPSASTASQAPQEPATQGTVREHKPFDGKEDAAALRKAMKGLGTDEKVITQIVGTRSNKQRQSIKLEYATLYGKDLIKDLKSELSSNYENLVVAMFMPPDEYDANEIFKAMEGVGTDEKALIEILCSRNNAQIQAAALHFKKKHGKDLEKELQSETSGHFRRLLVSLVQGSRLESQPLDHRKAADDAQALYKAGEAKWGTDESRFNVVLATRSFSQLRLTFDEYQKISKKTLLKAISSEMSGDLKDGMKAIVECSQNRAGFFAKQLHWSMKGLGTDDNTLIRIMVSRSEIDMVQIKSEFQRTFSKSLAQFIAGDCSGDYKKLLLQICGN